MNPFETDWNVNVSVKVAESKKVKEKVPDRKNYKTDITIILDKSGSMECLKDTVVNGFNEYFKKMKEAPGDNVWTLVQFDDADHARGASEQFPHTVFERRQEKDMALMEPSDYAPRGGTALVDAVCMSIKNIDARCSGVESEYKNVVMIVTDGQENSSREFGTPKMREMIGERQSKGWEFLFLAANQDAWSTAGQYNMQSTSVNNYGYAGMSVQAGAVAAGGSNAFSFNFNADGLRAAINSGMVGTMHIASGSLFANASK